MRIILWVLALLFGLIGAFVSSTYYPPGTVYPDLHMLGSRIEHFAFSTAAALVYLIPAFLALHRKHANTTSIVLLNILGGWTLLGWIGAIVWATLREADSPLSQAEKPALRNVYGVSLRLIGITFSIIGLLIFGFGIEQLGSFEALKHATINTSNKTSSLYLPGWIPILVGAAAFLGAIVLLHSEKFFRSNY